jgi:hypothetical protein
MMAKLLMMIKCTSVAARFVGLADTLVLGGVHRPMQHVQGYSGSHWTLLLGNYSLRIAPAAAGVTANKTTMKHAPNLMAILMAVAVRLNNTARIARWRRSRASLEATECHHWASIMSDDIKGTYLRQFY